MVTNLTIDSGPQCYFLVFRTLLDAQNEFRVCQGSVNWLIGLRNNHLNAAYFDNYNVLLGTSVLSLGTSLVVAVRQNASGSHLFVNGIDENNQVGEGYPGIFGFGGFTESAFPGDFGCCDLVEAAISDSDLSDSDIIDECNILMDKYGIL
jgi:hypothetical protein